MELPTFHRVKNSQKSVLTQNVETVQNPIRSAVLRENTFFPVFMANLLNENEILAINYLKNGENFVVFGMKCSCLPYFNIDSDRPKSGY